MSDVLLTIVAPHFRAVVYNRKVPPSIRLYVRPSVRLPVPPFHLEKRDLEGSLCDKRTKLA